MFTWSIVCICKICDAYNVVHKWYPRFCFAKLSMYRICSLQCFQVYGCVTVFMSREFTTLFSCKHFYVVQLIRTRILHMQEHGVHHNSYFLWYDGLVLTLDWLLLQETY